MNAQLNHPPSATVHAQETNAANAASARAPIAVIGAGVAGLTCAQELSKAGFRVVVFDKARAAGGRITTRRRDDFEWDMGASMMTASTPEFMEQIRAWQAWGVVRRWRGRFSGDDIGQSTSGPYYVGVPQMSELAKSLARKLDIRLSTKIEQIYQDADTAFWHLKDDEGQDCGSFQAVLSTMPRPQTALLYEAHVDVTNGLRQCGDLMPTWSVFVAFQTWLDVPYDCRTFGSGPLKAIIRNNAKPGRPAQPECWVLHADAALSSKFIEHSREAVAADLIAALEFTLDKKLPQIIEARAHRWRYALPVGEASFRCQFDNRLRLGFGGDWVKPPTDQFGGVEAAFLSGRALAQQTIALRATQRR